LKGRATSRPTSMASRRGSMPMLGEEVPIKDEDEKGDTKRSGSRHPSRQRSRTIGGGAPGGSRSKRYTKPDRESLHDLNSIKSKSSAPVRMYRRSLSMPNKIRRSRSGTGSSSGSGGATRC
jgi:hypothetical protein